jgi:type VI secretion system protein ImpJ
VFGTGKIVWKEGLFLQPQHFQQSERHLLAALNARLAAYHPYLYGVLEIAVDKEAAGNELFQLTRCRGVLPDGSSHDIPRDDPLPPARSFKDHFSPDQQSLDVYLGVPLMVEGKTNVGASQGSDVRFKTKIVQAVDEVSGGNKKEIETAVANYGILFGDEPLDNHATVRVAQLVRNQSGKVMVNEAHIPPLLQIGASPQLLDELRTVLQVLMARISALSQGRKQVEGGFAAFSGAEETAFRLLQTLNTYTPLLNHHHFVPTIHPFELYCLLNQFVGALCTFSIDVGIAQLPRYDHNNLTGTFGQLCTMIRSILEADIGAACITLPIEQINQATYLSRVPDQKLFAAARFFMGVSARAQEKEIIVGVATRIKMCSRDRLDLLISSAMPGLQLMHTTNLPEGLSTKPGFVYFSLDQQGPFWDAIKTSGSIAFYFPNNFQDLKIELLALKG